MRYTGKIIWFRKHLGYGFIKVKGDSVPNAFFHFSALKIEGYKNVKKNTPVSFDMHFSRLGPTALDVTIL